MSSPLDAVTGAKKPKRTRPAGAMFTVKIPLPPGATGYAASLLNASEEVYPPAFQQEGDFLVARPDAWPANVRILTPGGGEYDLPFTPPASGTEAIVDLSPIGGGSGTETGGGTTPAIPAGRGRLSLANLPPPWVMRTPEGDASASTRIEIAPGEYVLVATNPTTGETRSAPVTVVEGEEVAPPWSAFVATPAPQPSPVGFVTIRGITPTLSVEIDGQAVVVTNERPTLRIPPGDHRFVFKDVLSMANGPQNVPVRAEQTITVRAGDNLAVTPNFGPSWEVATRGQQAAGGGFPWLLALAVAGGGYYLWSQSQTDKGDE